VAVQVILGQQMEIYCDIGNSLTSRPLHKQFSLTGSPPLCLSIANCQEVSTPFHMASQKIFLSASYSSQLWPWESKQKQTKPGLPMKSEWQKGAWHPPAAC
jgi:hypothetical protein